MVWSSSALISIIYCASSTKKAAEKVSVIISRTMDDLNEAQRFKIFFFLAQARSRNLSIENFLFKINWTNYLTVSR